MEDQAKINFMGQYMREKANLWYMEYIEGRVGITWNRFCELLLIKLTPTSKDDFLIKFSTLSYDDDVNSYHEKFEELKGFVKSRYPALDDQFIMSRFLGGLPMELHVQIQKFKTGVWLETKRLGFLSQWRR